MSSRRVASLVGWVVWILWGSQAVADIRLPKIFSDQMVLQRGESFAIWGTADPNEMLTIQIADRVATATADSTGAWRTRLEPPIGTGPFELTIRGAQTKVVFQQVVVGEVWICTGQLNMHARIAEQPATPISDADWTGFDLRLFHVPLKATDHPQTDFAEPTVWERATAESMGRASAIAFHFGRELAQSLDVPVGVIVLSTPEGSCESWIPWDKLTAVPAFQTILADWTTNEGERLSKNRPGNLFNGMVRPLLPFNVRGVTWYQGESEVGRHALLSQSLPILLAAWREAFQQPELRFCFLQLPPFRYQGRPVDDLPRLWEVQTAVAGSPGACLVETWDLPPPAELTQVDKRAVANRQAKTVLAQVYDRERPSHPQPAFKQAAVEGKRIRVEFDHVQRLELQSDPALHPFQICGADQQFQVAQVAIDGNRLWLSSDGIEHPVAVRYAWTDTPQLDLVDQEQRPIPPFRSDQFGAADEVQRGK